MRAPKFGRISADVDHTTRTRGNVPNRKFVPKTVVILAKPESLYLYFGVAMGLPHADRQVIVRGWKRVGTSTLWPVRENACTRESLRNYVSVSSNIRTRSTPILILPDTTSTSLFISRHLKRSTKRLRVSPRSRTCIGLRKFNSLSG